MKSDVPLNVRVSVLSECAEISFKVMVLRKKCFIKNRLLPRETLCGVSISFVIRTVWKISKSI